MCHRSWVRAQTCSVLNLKKKFIVIQPFFVLSIYIFDTISLIFDVDETIGLRSAVPLSPLSTYIPMGK